MQGLIHRPLRRLIQAIGSLNVRGKMGMHYTTPFSMANKWQTTIGVHPTVNCTPTHRLKGEQKVSPYRAN